MFYYEVLPHATVHRFIVCHVIQVICTLIILKIFIFRVGKPGNENQLLEITFYHTKWFFALETLEPIVGIFPVKTGRKGTSGPGVYMQRLLIP